MKGLGRGEAACGWKSGGGEGGATSNTWARGHGCGRMYPCHSSPPHTPPPPSSSRCGALQLPPGARYRWSSSRRVVFTYFKVPTSQLHAGRDLVLYTRALLLPGLPRHEHHGDDLALLLLPAGDGQG